MVEPLLLSQVYRGVRDVGDQDQTPSDPGTQKPRIGIMICQTRTNSCKSRRNSGKNRIFTPEKNTSNSTVPAVDLLPDGLFARIPALWREKKGGFWGGRSGVLDLRSGIPVSPTEKFPGTGCRQGKMCKKCCTFTHFFEMCPIRSPIAKIRENCGTVKP